jgi:hypothetical protein
MDPVEIRLIRKIFNKGSTAAGFPLSSESPLKYESASYFSTANYAINLDSCGDIHCALGPPLAIENRRNLRRFFNTIVQFTNARSMHSAF